VPVLPVAGTSGSSALSSVWPILRTTFAAACVLAHMDLAHVDLAHVDMCGSHVWLSAAVLRHSRSRVAMAGEEAHIISHCDKFLS